MEEHVVTIRTATEADAGALLDIYRPYVTDTAVSFAYTVPAQEAFAGRLRQTLAQYPYLLAETDGQALGYTYASSLHARPAYQWSAETTIYLRQDARGRGLGRALYRALEDLLRAQHVRNLYACVAYAPQEDARLSNASAWFHERMGYRPVGRFTGCGYKFDRWYDILWLEKPLGGHGSPPQPVIPFPLLCGGQGDVKRITLE